MGPLAGVRVLDLTTVLMGPCATQMLGDLGAEVIKVEPPEGDIVRQIGPARTAGMGCMFLNVNRSKRSIVLDLKRPGGREVLLRLAATCDVVASNIRPAAMARLGLDYAALRAVNPGVIYVSMVGFGQDGPYAARPAYDDLIQGATGIAALFARASGDVPRYAPMTVADRVVALHASNAILAALLHRARTGQGQTIEVPMMEVMAAFVLTDHLGGLTFEPPLDQGGYGRLLSPDRRPFETADGHICAMVYNDGQWRRFFALVGQPERMNDPRMKSHATRTRHVAELYAEIAAIFRTRTSAEWLADLEAADIPCMPLHTLESLVADPHLAAVGFFERVEHPTEGPIRSMRLPMRFSETPSRPEHLAPRLGEHGRAILREAGCSEDEIARLVADGACREPLAATD